MSKLNFLLTIDTESGAFTITNQSTEQSETVSIKKQKKTAPMLEDNNTEPQVKLEDNKLVFNKAAIDLLAIAPGDRVGIRYEDTGAGMTPVIGTIFPDGNKLTKSFTIPYRGLANDELKKYGDVFGLSEKTKGLFYLKCSNNPYEVLDDSLSLPDGNIDNIEPIDTTDWESLLEDPRDVESPMHALDFTL